jgi:hypothetical protein
MATPTTGPIPVPGNVGLLAAFFGVRFRVDPITFAITVDDDPYNNVNVQKVERTGPGVYVFTTQTPVDLKKLAVTLNQTASGAAGFPLSKFEQTGTSGQELTLTLGEIDTTAPAALVFALVDPSEVHFTGFPINQG